MLANFFGKSSPANILIIFGVFVFYFLSNLIVRKDEIILADVAILLLVISSIIFVYNFILYKNKLTLYNSYGFLFFVILFGVFPFTVFDRSVLLQHVLLLIFLRRVYSMRSAKNHYSKLFDTGFWLGIFFLFEPFSVIFFVLIYTANSVFQKTSWRTILIPLIGFLMPLFCFYSFLFWNGNTDSFLSDFPWQIDLNISLYLQSGYKIPIILIGIITIFSYIVKTPKVLRISGDYRKYWTMVSVNLICAGGFILLISPKTGAEIQFLFFPTSIVITNWIESVKSKLIKELAIIAGLVLPIILLLI